MTRIIAGLDVSGTNEGNHKFMGVVIGTEENIRAIIKNLGDQELHMSKIRDRTQHKEIISQIRFNSNENTAFCIRIDKDRIVQQMLKTKRMQKSNISRAKIFRAYHYLLLRHMRESIEKFLIRHNSALSDVIFQCDGDCWNFAKDSGLNCIYKGDAYALSDIVAWANNKGLEPRGVVVMDLTQIIESDLKRFFKKFP